jgi:hypothetical protein
MPFRDKTDEATLALLSAFVQLKTGNRSNFAAKKRFGSQPISVGYSSKHVLLSVHLYTKCSFNGAIIIR